MTTPPYESWLKRYALYFAWIVTLVATGAACILVKLKGFYLVIYAGISASSCIRRSLF